MSRTEEAIEAGVLPGVDSIVLGGKRYPAREPSNARARIIRRALVDYEQARVAAGSKNAEQIELLEGLMDTCLKAFSPEIEGDWERIVDTATDSERLAAMKVVGDAVMVAFRTLAAPATPEPNREARRKKK